MKKMTKEIKTTFSNGEPYYPSAPIHRLTEKFNIRKSMRKPNLILIDGVSSSGKTTLGVHLMDAINKSNGFPPVDLSKDTLQIGTGTHDFISKLTKCADAGYPCIMFDEAGEYNKRGWNSMLNRVMDSILDTFRAYNIIIVMILHDFSELPKHVWTTRIVNLLIHLKERKSCYGRAYFYKQKRMYWVIKFKKDSVFPEDAYNKEHFNVKILFRNLSQERSDQLNVLSTAHKRNKLQNSEVKLKGLITYEEIHEKTGRSISWIKTQVSKLKINPEHMYKKKKYYNPNIVDRMNYMVKRKT